MKTVTSIICILACFLKNIALLEIYKRVEKLVKETDINPCITEQKNFLILRNWVHFLPIFCKFFSQHFFHGSINRLG
jgi:hypothetical protein